MTIFSFKELEQKHQHRYISGQTKLNEMDISNNKYYYTFALKEGDWFSECPINLILKHPMHPKNGSQYILYYEKKIEFDNYFRYIPNHPGSKFIRLTSIKTVFLQNLLLTIGYVDEKGKLQSLNVIFRNKEIASKWEQIITIRKQEVKGLIEEKQKHEDGIKKLNIEVRTLKGLLEEERAAKDTLKLQCNSLKEEIHHIKRLSEKKDEEISNLRKLQENQLKIVEKRHQKQYQQLDNKYSNELKEQKLINFELERQKLEFQKEINKLKKQLLEFRCSEVHIRSEMNYLRGRIRQETQFKTMLISKVVEKNNVIEDLKRTMNINQQADRSTILINEQDFINFHLP